MPSHAEPCHAMPSPARRAAPLCRTRERMRCEKPCPARPSPALPRLAAPCPLPRTLSDARCVDRATPSRAKPCRTLPCTAALPPTVSRERCVLPVIARRRIARPRLAYQETSKFRTPAADAAETTGQFQRLAQRLLRDNVLVELNPKADLPASRNHAPNFPD